MSMKPKRTLGPAAFEAYMNFADSLKNGSNNDTIDRFKYRFAVKEGYIRPKKAMTEAAGGGFLSLGDFEKAFTGLVGAFLPHMDQDEQEILSRVCANLDEKINSGDMGGAQDVLKGAMRDAGGDPDAFDGDEFCDDEACDDGDECDGDECPEGEECVDGECETANEGEAQEECGSKSGKAGKANSAKSEVEAIGDSTPGFGGDDSTEYSLDDDYGEGVDDIISRNHDMGSYGHGFDDDSEGFDTSGDVDYDALADMILSDHGYGNMTTANGGVGARNRGIMSNA